MSPTATPATSNGKPKPADEHFEAFWRIVLKTAPHKAVKKGEAQTAKVDIDWIGIDAKQENAHGPA